MHAIYSAAVTNLSALFLPMATTVHSPASGTEAVAPKCFYERVVGRGGIPDHLDRASLVRTVFQNITGLDFGAGISDQLARPYQRSVGLFSCNMFKAHAHAMAISKRGSAHISVEQVHVPMAQDGMDSFSEKSDSGPG